MKIYLMLALCVLFWSGNFVIGRAVQAELDSIELAFFRWGGVFLVMLPFFIMRFTNVKNILKSQFFLIVVLGLLGIAGFNTILYIGLHSTTAINALLINSIIPILILFLSSLILKTKITLLQFFGILISTFGVIFIVLKGELDGFEKVEFSKGDIWIVVSSITWALYSVLVKKRDKTFNDFDYFMTIVFVGIIALLPFYIYQNYPLIHTLEVVKKFSFQIIYVILFPSIASYYLWHQGIHEIGSAKTGQFTHLMPIFGTTLAVIFLNEQFMSYHIFGILSIFFGIYLSLFSKKSNV